MIIEGIETKPICSSTDLTDFLFNSITFRGRRCEIPVSSQRIQRIPANEFSTLKHLVVFKRRPNTSTFVLITLAVKKKYRDSKKKELSQLQRDSAPTELYSGHSRFPFKTYTFKRISTKFSTFLKTLAPTKKSFFKNTSKTVEDIETAYRQIRKSFNTVCTNVLAVCVLISPTGFE